MSTRSDEAPLASVGAAARELRLPTIRTEVARLAEIATRDRHCYLGFFIELLAAEVDDRAEGHRARRIADAKFLLLKRLSEFNADGPVSAGKQSPIQWLGTVFPDPRLVAATVDGTTFNAHIFETGAEPYRLRTGKTQRAC
jgi:hypothetical protein